MSRKIQSLKVVRHKGYIKNLSDFVFTIILFIDIFGFWFVFFYLKWRQNISSARLPRLPKQCLVALSLVRF